MEDCIVREVREFNKLSGLFLLASSMKDENAKNYKIEEMQKRWSNYLMFNVLEHKGRPISFSGVYKYSDNLVEQIDCLHYQNIDKILTKGIVEKLDDPLYTISNKCKARVLIVSFNTNIKERTLLKRLTKLVID